MDISDIVPTAREYELLHPGTKAPMGIFISLLPMEHPTVKKVTMQLTNEVSFKRAKGKIISAEETETIKRKVVSAAVTGWRWIGTVTGIDPDTKEKIIEPATWRGAVPEFSPAKVVEFLESSAWALDQLDDELGDTTSFFKR